MLASELIKLIQDKIDKYWDENIRLREWSYHDYKTYNIESISHKWEDWLVINIE